MHPDRLLVSMIDRSIYIATTFQHEDFQKVVVATVDNFGNVLSALNATHAAAAASTSTSTEGRRRMYNLFTFQSLEQFVGAIGARISM